MIGTVAIAPAGARGFDCNAYVSPTDAAKFVARGYTFALRYAPRLRTHSGDLTAVELGGLLTAGLAVGVVQHYEGDGWTPTPENGTVYGQTAASFCADIGIAQGVYVWLDLEGVNSVVSSDQIIRYCNNWYEEVEKAGYAAGLYVGHDARLNPGQLYNLSFERYWGALNLNVDEFPAIRGLCMKQHEEKPGDLPTGVSYAIDTDTVMADHRGCLPTFHAPPNWHV